MARVSIDKAAYLTDRMAQARHKMVVSIINTLKKTKGASLEDIANTTGISRGSLSDYYNNKRKVTQKTLEKLLSAKDLPMTPDEKFRALEQESNELRDILNDNVQIYSNLSIKIETLTQKVQYLTSLVESLTQEDTITPC